MNSLQNKLDLFEKIQVGISYLIRLAIIVAIAGEILNRSWALLFASAVVLVLTFLPALIERNYKILLPIELEFVIVLFIYASLFLGEIRGYYTRLWWWDIVLHTGFGVLLGFAGFLILYILLLQNKVKTKPIWIAVFSFSFAVAIGAVWEIFEFTVDNTFGTNMQKSGNVDTMWDLIVDSFGALIISITGYFYIKGIKTPLFYGVFRKFVKENPQLFKKLKIKSASKQTRSIL